MKQQSARRAFWEHLKTPEGGEIRRQAIAGGTISALLLCFETFHPKNSFQLASFWLAMFVIGVGVIPLVEYWIQRRNPIRLAEIGTVDGIWVYGFRDVSGEERQFSGGSVVRVTSSGLGFKVEGHMYPDAKLPRRGFFAGNGLSKGNAVNFHYEGEGSGVGRYIFTPECYLTGELTGSGLDKTKPVSSQEVRGYRISDRVVDDFDGPAEREALRQCLKELNRRPDEAKISLPRAGIVDGWWIDAVYEERGLGWAPVKGSIMKFETVAASGRFTVVGDSYVSEELDEARDPGEVWPNYSFGGQGRRLEKGSAEGFYYEYYGRNGRPARGVGYYEFDKRAEEAATFAGSFLRTPPGEPNCIVYGVKIADDLDVKEQRRQLHEHLETCLANIPAVIESANRLQHEPEQASSAVGG